MEKKLKILGILLVLGIVFFVNLISADSGECSKLSDSECNNNYKCVLDSKPFFIFEFGKCIDAQNYYEKIAESKKIEKDVSAKGISGFFTKIYRTITGKSLKGDLIYEENLGENIGVGQKETFYMNAGNKLLAKIVME